MKKSKPHKDLTGQRFRKLVVVSWVQSPQPYTKDESGKYHGKSGRWLCRCDCGKTSRMTTYQLKSGKTRSCGCLQPAAAKKAKTTHGETIDRKVSSEYYSFSNAKDRCQNKSNPAYPRYGGRGIQFRFATVQNLIDAVGRRPTPSHSLDRIDTNGHYEAGNVRWATPTEQARNRNKRALTKFIVCPHCDCKVFGVKPTTPKGKPHAFPTEDRTVS